MAAYTWNREKQMFIALGKEFDMVDGDHVKISSTSLFISTQNKPEKLYSDHL